MKTSNPTLNQKLIRDFSFQRTESGEMTVQGTVNKIAIMLILVLAGALFTWNKFFAATDAAAASSSVMGWMIFGAIGGLVMALITFFNKKRAAIFAPLYAVFQGLFIGAISAFFEAMYPGLVLRAVSLTFAVLFSLLFAYKTRIIKVTDKLRAGIFAATAGIAVAYLASFVLGLFGINMSFMHGGGTLGIIISLVIVVVAALNLVLDFDFIEKGSEAKLPGYFEWYGAFGLMVTLIWLYLEILRLLSYLTGRD